MRARRAEIACVCFPVPHAPFVSRCLLRVYAWFEFEIDFPVVRGISCLLFCAASRSARAMAR